MTQHTAATVLDHHLSQNLGQKITPHLIAGLVQLYVANCKALGIPTTIPQPAPDTTEVPNG